MKQCRAMLAFYYGFTAAAAVYRLGREGTVYHLLLVAAALALPAVPKIVYRVCRLRPVALVDSVFLAFVWAAVPFASLAGGYEWIPYWDKVLHCLSGFLFAALGTVVYFSNKPGHTLEPEDAVNAALFTWNFALMSAVLWEFWEYFVSLFGADPQQVAATGVADTMQDMLVCALGGLVTALSCAKYLKTGGKGHTGLMMRLFAAYYRENIQNKQQKPV